MHIGLLSLFLIRSPIAINNKVLSETPSCLLFLNIGLYLCMYLCTCIFIYIYICIRYMYVCSCTYVYTFIGIPCSNKIMRRWGGRGGGGVLGVDANVKMSPYQHKNPLGSVIFIADISIHGKTIIILKLDIFFFNTGDCNRAGQMQKIQKFIHVESIYQRFNEATLGTENFQFYFSEKIFLSVCLCR